jgi:hypothetical protein
MFSEAAGCFSGRYAGLEEKNAFEAGGFLNIPRAETMIRGKSRMPKEA